MIELLKQLEQKNIRIEAVDGALKVKAPKGAMTPDLATAIKTNKDKLLHFLERRQAVASTQATSGIQATDRSKRLPASWSQQRLWFIDQLSGTSVEYNLASALKFEGKLELDALQHSLNEIVQRHEVLRTTFRVEDDVCCQHIQQQVTLPLIVKDLTSHQQPDTALNSLMEQEALTPFNLAEDLMLRVTVIKLAEQVHVLLLTMHHIAADGWSMNILVSEFSQFYQAFLQHEQPSLPPLSIQYADYAAWQRETLDENKRASLLSYWTERLADSPAIHSLPLDYPRPEKQQFTAGHIPYRIDKQRLQGLEQLAVKAGATLSMVLQAAYALVLGRFSDSNDIVMGIPNAGRTTTGVEPLIGFFINTLVNRIQLQPDESFVELLARVKQQTLADYTHQALPFELLVDELNPTRNLAWNPVCQIKFVLQNHREAAASDQQQGLMLPNLAVTPMSQDTDHVRFDLDLTCVESSDGLVVNWRYQTALFHPASIERIAASFDTLISQILAEPTTPYQQLSMMTPAQRADELAASVGIAASDRRDSTIVEDIIVQAARTPEQLAVFHDGSSLSYRELVEKANQLAWYLDELEIGPGSRVAVYMARTPLLLVALLGIMRAGAAYVPIPPGAGENRLATILADEDTELVLVSSSMLGELPVSGVDVLILDEQEWPLDDYETHAPDVACNLDDNAYVIYTSGSTGKPKGVEITHRGLIDYCAFSLNHYYHDKLSGSLVVTSHGFDIVVPALYVPLMAGGTVNLTPWNDEIEAMIAAFSADEQSWLVRMTPMHVEGFLATAGDQTFSGRHVFVIGGEAFLADVGQRLQQACPNSIIYNHYGPTEAVVGCCIFPLSEHLQQGETFSGALPIGYAMENTHLLVLDEQQQLQVPGAAGELYVGGPCLARGYLHDAGKTAEAFVANPISDYSDQLSRLYRTGDKVRRLPSGALTFIGRADDQVKLRGYRIEPGEVASLLQQLPGVSQAVVGLVGEGIDAALAAWIVPENTAIVDAMSDEFIRQLEEGLDGQLPAYMMPTRWQLLASLPLNANGKLNRKALPEPGKSHEGEQQLAYASNALEQQIATIWQTVLKHDGDVPVNQGFFRLGGHSLLAVMVISQLNEAFDIQLTVRDLFDCNTVAALAQRIADNQGATKQVILPAERLADGMPLSFAQQRIWFVEQLESGSSQFNMPAALRIKGELRVDCVLQACNALITRHEILRTRFTTRADNTPVQKVSESANLILQTHTVTGSDEQQVAQAGRIIDADAEKPFNLQTDLLLRVGLIEFAQDDHVLFFTVHHIAADGWSLDILFDEFVQFYQAAKSGEAASLPPLAIQYADFAAWQRSDEQAEQQHAALEYWTSLLADAPATHRLPLEQPRSSATLEGGAKLETQIPARLSESLKQLAASQDATLFMALQASFALLLGRFSREQDIVMGMPAVGRPVQSCESLIGLFLNTLVLRTTLTESDSFVELLNRTREHHLDVHQHAELPFEHLVEAINPERSLYHTPIFQVFINMNNAERDVTALQDNQVSAFARDDAQDSKYDLTLYLRESSGGIQCTFAYNQHLFSTETIQSLATEFEYLLSQVVKQPEQALSALRWRQQQGFTQPTVESAIDQLAHTRFEQLAATRPDDIALYISEKNADTDTISYQQLNDQANQLAHWLMHEQALNVGDCVGLCTERNQYRFIAALAVLKAGGVMVPLSRDLPSARLRYMAGDAQVKCILADDEPDVAFDAPVVLLNHKNTSHDSRSIQAELSNQPTHNPVLEAEHQPELAHIIYTSGSTGQPKGVLGTHAATVHRVNWMLQQWPFAATEINAHITSMSFIRGIWELFVGLSAGVPQVVLSRDTVKDAVHFSQAVRQFNITRLVTTPSHLRNLLQDNAGFSDRFEQIKHWFVSGESFPDELARYVVRQLPETRFTNLYGSTEVMSDVLMQPITSATTNMVGRMPLGDAVAGHAVNVLDEQLQPVPPGAVGELVVSGAQVAHGYLGRQQQSEAAFFSLNSVPSYRTGDLARVTFRPDEHGQLSRSLIFVGRKDYQLKIRGYRIELGEIENALREHAAVNDAVVVVNYAATSSDDVLLVAYLKSMDSDAAALIDSVKQSLAEKLPAYMMPNQWCVLPEFPLTVNGKLDRRALPAPQRQLQQARVAPTTATETTLVTIWTELLRLPAEQAPGVTENFFELGGHSLLATRMVSAISQQLARVVQVKAIFQHNTIRSLANYLEQLTESSALHIPTVDRATDIPLSYAQQRLWFVDQVDSNSTQYNMPLVLNVAGAFDVAIAEQALTLIVERHDILRTVYKAAEPQPLQVIRDARPFSVTTFESVLSQAQTQQIIEEFLAYQFTLDDDLMIRAAWLQTAPEAGVLLLNLHHIASDGWSMGILINEFVSCYQALRQQQSPDLPPLPIQYADFAAWQRQQLDGEGLAQQLAYWRKQLTDVAGVHNLPLDRSRPEVRQARGEKLEALLDAETSRLLQTVATTHNCSMYMVLHAALSLVISKHGNQQDVVIGCPVANRTHHQVEPLIGLFVNTLVLRTQIDHDTFSDYLAHVRQVNLDAHSHQDVPFEQVVELCQLQRSAKHTPLVQILLNMNNTVPGERAIEGVSFSAYETQDVVAKTDLSIGVAVSSDGLSVNWIFDTSIFDRATIARFNQHLFSVLQQVAHNPEQALNSLNILDEGEIQRLLAPCQHFYDPQAWPELAHQFLERQAELQPDATALVFDGETMSYRTLDTAANQLAHYLIAQGVSPDAVVGICVERSLDMVVALYACWKAGAAYLPLDPGYPLARLTFMLDMADVSLVLAQQAFADLFEDMQGKHVIAIDDPVIKTDVQQCPQIAPECAVTATSLAYIVFTSGSTGEPKGVMVEHKQIVASTRSRHQVYDTDNAKFLSLSSISFDASLIGITGALGAGAELHILSSSESVDVGRIFLYCEATQITHLAMPPGMYRAFHQCVADAGSIESSLKLVLTGGEGVEQDLKAMHFDSSYSRQAKLYNEYGPTEATIWSSVYQITEQDYQPVAPIGQSPGHVNLYVMDRSLQLAPFGAEGELYIGGPGVTRGYLNQKALTAERYVTLHRPDGRTDRVYKTGDLVRYKADGNLMFVGRADDQIKLRGYRIELSEIENHISKCEGVAANVVMVREDKPGLKQLVAYLVPSSEHQALSGDASSTGHGLTETISESVKRYLQQQLPAFMVPSLIIPVPEFTFKDNGKVNKSALPAPDPSLLAGEFVAPETTIEQALAVIWAELLSQQVDDISANANFFELGGHSLLAVRLTSQINQQFSLELSIKQIFDTPVLRKLAQAIEQQQVPDDVDLLAAADELEGLSDAEIEALYQQLNGAEDNE